MVIVSNVRYYCSACHKPRSHRFHRRQASTATILPSTCSRSSCHGKVKPRVADGLPECGYALVTYWVPLQHTPSALGVLQSGIPELPSQLTRSPMFEADSRALDYPSSLRIKSLSSQHENVTSTCTFT
jgi:hypothetical protein